MGDGEFGLRAYLNGFKSINNPKAERIHLKVSSGGLRELGSWDGVRSTKLMQPIPIPSTLYFFRKYWGWKKTILYLLQTIPLSLSPYHLKGSKIGMILSLSILFFLFPFILLKIFWSWVISNKMLKKGPLIENFYR